MMGKRQFRLGERVKVREGDPPGHIRTPFYLRGKVGVIEAQHGVFRNPEKLAFGKPGLPKQALYLVRFYQAEVWPDYEGSSHDSVTADIYEHWLQLVEV